MEKIFPNNAVNGITNVVRLSEKVYKDKTEVVIRV